jgi:LacI family transcriptional regulator
MPNLKVTQQDIADALNISRASVSKVFNNKPISSRAREIILKKAVEMGYIDSYSNNHTGQAEGAGAAGEDRPEGLILLAYFARKAPHGESGGAAVSVQRFQDLILGMERACKAHNYRLIVSVLTDGGASAVQLLNDYFASNIDGIVFSGDFSEIGGIFGNGGAGVPFILADVFDMTRNRFIENDVIMFDFTGAMSAMLKRLADAGCGKFAYVGGQAGVYANELRMSFLCGCIENKVEACAACVDSASARASIRRRFAESGGAIKERPDAFICESDETAFEIMRELLSNRYSVPEDVCVAGFDSVDDAGALENGLTTSLFSREDLGFKAAEQLIWRIRNPHCSPVTISLRSRVAFRNSTSRLAV